MECAHNIAAQIVANPPVGMKLQMQDPKRERDWVEMNGHRRPAELLVANREVVMPFLEWNGTCLSEHNFPIEFRFSCLVRAEVRA